MGEMEGVERERVLKLRRVGRERKREEGAEYDGGEIEQHIYGVDGKAN